MLIRFDQFAFSFHRVHPHSDTILDMQITSLIDITGDGSTQPLAVTPLKAKWVQVVTPAGNAASVRIGGVETTASRGLPIPPGWAGMMLPPVAEIASLYKLDHIYYNVSAGDHLYVLYAYA
jgi:hypothetical protein